MHILFIWGLEGGMLNSKAVSMMIQHCCCQSPHGDLEVRET